MSHWHGLAKLHMHSDLTLKILDKTTTDFSKQFHLSKEMVYTSYQTQELDCEVDAQIADRQRRWLSMLKMANGKGKKKKKKRTGKSRAATWCTWTKTTAKEEIIQYSNL
jgi:hypothetical protein